MTEAQISEKLLSKKQTNKKHINKLRNTKVYFTLVLFQNFRNNCLKTMAKKKRSEFTAELAFTLLNYFLESTHVYIKLFLN